MSNLEIARRILDSLDRGYDITDQQLGILRAALRLPQAQVRIFEREPGCVAAWPECAPGEYDPRCCRFPKSCSVRSLEQVRIFGADPDAFAAAVRRAHRIATARAFANDPFARTVPVLAAAVGMAQAIIDNLLEELGEPQ